MTHKIRDRCAGSEIQPNKDPLVGIHERLFKESTWTFQGSYEQKQRERGAEDYNHQEQHLFYWHPFLFREVGP